LLSFLLALLASLSSLSLLTLLVLLALLITRLQAPFHRFEPLDGFAGLIQRALQLLLFGVICRRCSLADLFFHVGKSFLDFALVARGIVVIAVIEELPALVHLALQISRFDRIGGASSFVGSIAVFLIVTQR